jgi:class 3 adenylate cyclase
MKFIGDGLLAVFGAPERHDDHADRAVAAALQLAAAVRKRFAGELSVGVGVNTGQVVAGTIGGGGRVDFTVIGDAVNTAARVESATRQTGDDVLITEATRAALADPGDAWTPRPPVALKGKTEPVALYAPAGKPRSARFEHDHGDLPARDPAVRLRSGKPLDPARP